MLKHIYIYSRNVYWTRKAFKKEEIHVLCSLDEMCIMQSKPHQCLAETKFSNNNNEGK